MRRVALVLLLTGLLASGQGWHNGYDEPLNFKCPRDQSISSIMSKNNNYHEDRQWAFGCKHTCGHGTGCFLSQYINNFDEDFTFECPPNHEIAGMNSYHNNYYEDRRWQFYCCRSNCDLSNCLWTPHVNQFDETFNWNVPNYHVLVGTKSYHHNYFEDRQWKYKYCVQKSG